jgi:aconitate hydratase
MGRSVARKLLESHLVEGDLAPGSEIAIRIGETLTQDATATLVMLELEAMALDRVRTELSAQYVDHNLIQTDSTIRTTMSSGAARVGGLASGIWTATSPSGW